MRYLLLVFFSFFSLSAQAFTVDSQTIVIKDAITVKTLGALKDILSKRESGSTVKMVFDSEGGDTIASAEIVNLMYRFKTDCYAIKAYSAAFNIFQFCDTRTIGSESKMMVHFSYFRSSSGPVRIERQDLVTTFAILSFYDGFFLGNISRRTGISMPELFSTIEKQRDWHITPILAKTLRMVDHVQPIKQ